MVVLLFWMPNLACYYVCYVLIFNILTAPVFMAGAITGERERQTLDLLLTTTITTRQILMGKLVSGYWIGAVLTAFLMFPMLLACINPELARNILAMIVYVAIIFVASVFNSVLSLFVSTLVRKTSTALMSCYVALIALYFLPLSIYYLVWSTSTTDINLESTPIQYACSTSPLMAAYSVPMFQVLSGKDIAQAKSGDISLVVAYFVITIISIFVLFLLTSWFFRERWRLTGRG